MKALGLLGMVISVAVVAFVARQQLRGTPTHPVGSAAGSSAPARGTPPTEQVRQDLERALQQAADRASEADR